VRIGNSRGIRIPKPILEQAGLEDEVTLTVTERGIIIKSTDRPRRDWAIAAKVLCERGEDGLLDEPTPTAFDKEDWEWE
jgi:antitoxin MazE